MKLRKGSIIRTVSSDWKRIAIVGTQKSGKTVFLTSVIWLLKEYDRDLEEIKDFEYQSTLDFKGIPPRRSDIPSFNFEANRSQLIEAREWPTKTSDSHIYRCSFKATDKKGKRHTQKLEFLDFPGERMADGFMYKHSYSEWSHFVLNALQASTALKNEYAAFYDTISKTTIDHRTAVDAYKTLLKCAYSKYFMLMVSPSVFLLDQKGSALGKNSNPAERSCGLDGMDFVPLPVEARQANKELYQKFKKNYDAYKKAVVNPLFTWLLDAEQMYMLINVLAVLSAGVDHYNDTRELIKTVLSHARDKQDHWTSGFLGLVRLARLKKFGFVVPQCDRVIKEDRDNMLRIATELVGKDRQLLNKNVDSGFFVCAAINSSESTQENGKALIRIRESENDWVTTSRVPEKVPETEWKGFSYPRIKPVVPYRNNKTPKERGMGKILTFMLSPNQKPSSEQKSKP